MLKPTNPTPITVRLFRIPKSQTKTFMNKLQLLVRVWGVCLTIFQLKELVMAGQPEVCPPRN